MNMNQMIKYTYLTFFIFDRHLKLVEIDGNHYYTRPDEPLYWMNESCPIPFVFKYGIFKQYNLVSA